MLLATIPEWVPLVAPFLGVATAMIGVVVGLRPWLSDRKAKEAAIKDQIQRGDSALELIFGVEEDKRQGILARKGILARLDEIDARLDKLDKLDERDDR